LRARSAIDRNVPGRGISGLEFVVHQEEWRFFPKAGALLGPCISSIYPYTDVRSTRDHRGNLIPILATVRLQCSLQLEVFVFRPYTHTSSRQGYSGIQGIIPFLIAHFVRLGTIVAILFQFLPPCVCTAVFRSRSSSSVHAPVLPVLRATLNPRHYAIC
jgi:hypothetical protein